MNEQMNEMIQEQEMNPTQPTEEEVSSSQVEGQADNDQDVSAENQEEQGGEENQDNDNPLNKYTLQQLGALLKQLRTIVEMMEDTWKSDVATFGVTHEHMAELYKWNQEHLIPAPETPAVDENGNEIKWDPTNGISSITEEKVLEIFGEGHKIIGVEHTVTIDRLKDIFEDFYNWTHALADYRDANNAYIQLIDEKEALEIETLQKIMSETEDEEKKAKIQRALDEYWNRIYLEFLADPLPEDMVNRMIGRLNDQRKMTYILERTTAKLHQMHLSTQFIPEIVKFESTMMDPKYAECDGSLLMYFADVISHADASNKHDDRRNRAIYMVVVLDRMIRNQMKPDVKERVMANIIKFEEQMINLVPRKVIDMKVTPPLTDPVHGDTTEQPSETQN